MSISAKKPLQFMENWLKNWRHLYYRIKKIMSSHMHTALSAIFLFWCRNSEFPKKNFRVWHRASNLTHYIFLIKNGDKCVIVIHTTYFWLKHRTSKFCSKSCNKTFFVGRRLLQRASLDRQWRVWLENAVCFRNKTQQLEKKRKNKTRTSVVREWYVNYTVRM